MKGTDGQRWYLDSTVIVAFLQNEQTMEGDHTRGQIAKWVLDQRGNGSTELYTSMLGIIEANGGKAGADPELRAKIERFFLEENTLTLIDVDYTVAERARALTWQLRDDGCPVKHNIDIAHVAAAINAECADVLTFDRQHMVKLDAFIDGINIRVPSIEGQLDLTM